MTSTTPLRRSAAAIAAATPPDRDRYLDLLRGAAIAVVVVGHWLAAVVWATDGGLRAASVVDLAPASRWVTWFVQVMPVFFLVGGAVNARSWRSATAQGMSWSAWTAARAARLLRPTVLLVGFWTVATPSLAVAGVDRTLLTTGARAALVPLWFLAVYLLVVALTPALLAVHARWRLLLPIALIAAAAVIDIVARSGVPGIALVNYLVVWSVPTAFGFAWDDGMLDRRAVRIGLPVTGLVALLAAVTWFGYPVSMVGVAGAGDTGGVNAPAVTLALLGCVQTGIVLAARHPLSRWLQRPVVWAAVVTLTSTAMTVYLWHLTVLVLGVGALTLTGDWWSVTPLSPGWWLSRPLWIVGLAIALAPVVVALRRFEHGPGPQRTPRTAGTVATVVGASAATAAVTLSGGLGITAITGAVGLTVAARTVGALPMRTAVGR